MSMVLTPSQSFNVIYTQPPVIKELLTKQQHFRNSFSITHDTFYAIVIIWSGVVVSVSLLCLKHFFWFVMNDRNSLRDKLFHSIMHDLFHFFKPIIYHTRTKVTPQSQWKLDLRCKAWPTSETKNFSNSQKMAASPPFLLAPAPIRKKLWP